MRSCRDGRNRLARSVWFLLLESQRFGLSIRSYVTCSKLGQNLLSRIAMVTLEIAARDRRLWFITENLSCVFAVRMII